MEFHQHADGYYYLEPKSDLNVASVDGVGFATFAEAFKCLQNQDRALISLLRDASVDEMLTLSAGKALTIDLNGCRIDAPDGFIANYGDLSIRDGGNRLTVSGVVTTPEKCVIENFEGGEADICYGVYQGKFVVNGGTLTTHHGKFTGAIVKNGGTLRLKGGVFSSDVTNLLDEGYLAFPRGGLYYVGRFPKPDLSTVDIANTDIAFRLLAMPESDETLYVEKGAASLGADEDEWKYIAELNAAYKFFAGNFYIDILINSDRPIAEGSAKLTVKSGGLSFTQSIEDLPADKLTRVLSPRITMTQISYARFIDDDEDKWDNMEAGFSDVENANRGTKITLSMDLWNWHERHHTDPKKDQMDTFLTIINKPYVFGSGDNVAMLQAAEGPTPAENFFATLQGAVDAPATAEKTIKLCNDCDEDVTVAKSCAIDLNGFEFTGSFVKGDGVEETVEGTVHTFVATAPERPPVVAMIGDVEYASLAAAVRAATYSKDGVVIVLCENTNEKVTLPAWVRISLNGHEAANLACPNGYKLLKDNGSVTIVEMYVAMIGSESYESLADAIQAANNGAVVKLLKSTDEEISVGVVCTIVKNGFECPNVSADEENLFEFAEDNGVIAIVHPKVARVGEQYYTDIQDAVDAAVEQGETVVLVWECADEIVFDAPCTVNLDVTGYNFLGDVVVSAANLSVSQRFSSDHIMALTVAEAKQVDVTVSSSDTKDENAVAKVSSELVATIASTVGDRDDETEAEKQQRVEQAVQDYVAEVISSGAHTSVGFAEVVKTVEVKDGKEVTKTEIKNELSETVNDRPAAKDLKSGVYQQTKIYGGGADGGNFAVADMSVDAITVIKTDSSDDTLMLAVPGDKTENGEPFTVETVIASDKVLGDEIRVYVNENGVSGFRTWVWTDKDGCCDDLHWHPFGPIGGSEVQPCEASAQQLKAGDTFQYTRKGHHKPVTVVAAYKGDIKTEIKDQGTKEAGNTAWNMVANPVPAVFDIQSIKPTDSASGIENDSIVIPAANGEGEKIFRRKGDRWGYNKTVVVKKMIGGKEREVATSQWVDSGDDTKIGVGKGFWYLSAGGKPTINWKVEDAK